jgi:hypothetical protein
LPTLSEKSPSSFASFLSLRRNVLCLLRYWPSPWA